MEGMDDFDFGGVIRLMATERKRRAALLLKIPEGNTKQITLHMEREMRNSEDKAMRELGYDPIPDDEVTLLIAKM